MQTFEDFWDKVDNISFRTRESLASESFAAAARPRDQEIERLRTRLAALEAAVDKVIRIADSGGGKLPHVIWAAIDRLRSARGQQTGG